jgi:hypothetical protein
MLAFKLQMLVNHPEESTWHSKQSESLKSRISYFILQHYFYTNNFMQNVGQQTSAHQLDTSGPEKTSHKLHITLLGH